MLINDGIFLYGIYVDTKNAQIFLKFQQYLGKKYFIK